MAAPRLLSAGHRSGRCSDWTFTRLLGILILPFALSVAFGNYPSFAHGNTWHFTVLHSFSEKANVSDGEEPRGGLVQGRDGSFYGTTAWGGYGWLNTPDDQGDGIVYRADASGQYTILYSFTESQKGQNGMYPTGSLVQGPDGSFYGLTERGGAANIGTVFKITPSGKIAILHSFGALRANSDGYDPVGGLVLAADGDFYGTTADGGGLNDDGTVFKITPNGQFTTLHTFLKNTPNSGWRPSSSLIQGRNGNFYGTTLYGGAAVSKNNPNGYGTVFRMTPAGDVTFLHSFGDGTVPKDGKYPQATLVQGRDGNIYGVTHDGGPVGYGTIFRMSPSGQVAILYSFAGGEIKNDGKYPVGLIQASDGNFYGATYQGGSREAGTLFQMTPSGNVTILHEFLTGEARNAGEYPPSAPIEGADGSLYGTSDGAIYQLRPNTPRRANKLASAYSH